MTVHSRKGTDEGRVPRAQSGRGGGWISTLWRVSKPFHLTTDRRRDRPNERIDRCPLSVHSDVLPRAPRRKSGQRSTGRRATAERGLSSGNYNAAEEEEVEEDTTCDAAVVVARTSLSLCLSLSLSLSPYSPLRGLSSPAALNPNIVREVK